MKRSLLVLSLLVLTLILRAQQEYFVFIQSENSQPYYIQTNEKVLSSSSIGHLIIAGLKDSMYMLAIGFPKNQFPEQVFRITVNKKDAGYQLKNMGADGWALFNMHTLQLIKAQSVETRKQTISYGDIKKTDHFSALMAGLVDDTAVLYTSVVRKEPLAESSKTSLPDSQAIQSEVEKPKDTVATIATSTPAIQLEKTDLPVEKTDTLAIAAKKQDAFKPSVILLNQEKRHQGTQWIYLDRTSLSEVDTINVFISIEEAIIQPALPVLDTIDRKNIESTNKKIISNESVLPPTPPLLDSVKPLASENIGNSPVIKSTDAGSGDKKVVLINSDCIAFATDYDVDKLRIRMLGEKDADGQVIQARKVFKAKCFSTKQIKALTELFRTDEGRYKLFDAAYPFVSDTENFKDLAGLLSEDYYINRFKAMLRM